jgi:hypothetical protein|nr:MAG TPA: hypothetical protein [Caudoviricetes sp.]
MTIREFLEMATDTTTGNIVLYNYEEQENFYDGEIDTLIENVDEHPESELAVILNSELQQWDVCGGKLNINFEWLDIYDNNPELLKRHLNE